MSLDQAVTAVCILDRRWKITWKDPSRAAVDPVLTVSRLLKSCGVRRKIKQEPEGMRDPGSGPESAMSQAKVHHPVEPLSSCKMETGSLTSGTQKDCCVPPVRMESS